MKIRVQKPDLEIETVTLVPPVELREGDGLSCLHCGDSTDHFFTSDGFYDGWGRALPTSVSIEHAKEIIEKVEAARALREGEGVKGRSWWEDDMNFT